MELSSHPTVRRIHEKGERVARAIDAAELRPVPSGQCRRRRHRGLHRNVMRVESLYVVEGSDAEAHARRRFPNKPLHHVRGRLRARTIEGLIQGMPVTFQRGRAAGLAARYHFSFRGDEETDVSGCGCGVRSASCAASASASRHDWVRGTARTHHAARRLIDPDGPIHLLPI
jgi:hypothetical protein